MVQRVLDHYGQLDAVYANAGIPGSEGRFSGADPEVCKTMLLTNVYGVGLTLRCTLAALTASRAVAAPIPDEAPVISSTGSLMVVTQ